MTENTNPKVNPAVISRLNSGIEINVLDALADLNETGNLHYIPHLIDLLIISEFESVKKRIIQLLSDLKDLKSRSYIIEAIKNDKYTRVRKDLLTACWQNGLDFSEYVPLFVGLVIDSEFETAFEAFTVIDSQEFKPDTAIREKEIVRIDQALLTSEGSKKYLLQELRNILEED